MGRFIKFVRNSQRDANGGLNKVNRKHSSGHSEKWGFDDELVDGISQASKTT